MTPNKLQQRVLTSRKPVKLIATGCASGKTTALIMSALQNQGNTLLITPHIKSHMLSQITDLLSSLGITYNMYCNRVLIKLGNYEQHIRFSDSKCPTNLIRMYDNIVVDEAHLIPDVAETVIAHCLNRHIILTSLPYECGWRNPRFDNGVFTGKYNEFSWDHMLYKKTANFKPKVDIEEYRDFVDVITDFSFRDNIYLGRSFGDDFDNLNCRDQYKLRGTW